mgnify:CR=1 FL=1
MRGRGHGGDTFAVVPPSSFRPSVRVAIVACMLASACRAPLPGCTITLDRAPLPDAVHESSGAAWSRTRPGTWWTVSDEGPVPMLHAFDTTGAALARVRVENAAVRDWEDLAAGPCTSGAGDCLYIADIGDNDAVRQTITIYEVREPAPGDSVSAPARRIDTRIPNGPRDAEAFTVLPAADGTLDVVLVSKGRRSPIDLYTGTLRADTPLVLVQRHRLASQPHSGLDRVTGAGASPDGAWIAVRTYAALSIYRRDSLLAAGTPTQRIPLGALREQQGEAVAMGGDGRILVTSEGSPARASVLRCPLPPAAVR